MSNPARENGNPALDSPHIEADVQPGEAPEQEQTASMQAQPGGAYPPPDQAQTMPSGQPGYVPQHGDPAAGGGYGGTHDQGDQYTGGGFEPRQAPHADLHAGQPAEIASGSVYASAEAPQQYANPDQGYAAQPAAPSGQVPESAPPAHEPARHEQPAGQPGHEEQAPHDETMQPTAPIASPDEDWVPPATALAPEPPASPAMPGDINAKPLPRINIQAFCEDQNTAALLQNASQDRRLSKTHVSVQMGGLEAAAHYYRNAPTPNLIIIESMHERDAMLMDVDRLASVCDSGTKVIVIGHVNDVLLYRELLKRGVSEYLVMPLGVPQLMQSLSTLYNDPSSDPLGSVLAFVGAKGGVGSSTVCHNTAWAISQGIQSDVVIADLDLPFGTAGLDFNQDPVQGIADALLSPERLDDVLLDRLLSRCSDYLSLFAAPGTLDRSYDLSAGACDVVMDVLRKNVPYIAMDVPHIWTDWAQNVLVQADRVVITAIPDLANLRNTKNLVDKLTAARPNDLPPLLVLNQLGVPKRPEISVKDFAGAVETEPTCIIDFDAQLFGTASNNGQMIEEVSAKAKAAEQFQLLARRLTDRAEAKAEPKSILAPILSRLGGGGQPKKSKKKAGKA